MGTNDTRILSLKYYKLSEQYYNAGFQTKRLNERYKFWQTALLFKKIAECHEKLEKKGITINE